MAHGPELVAFARTNYAQYKDVADRLASMSKQGVCFNACKNAAAAEGCAPEDLYGFMTAVPASHYALA